MDPSFAQAATPFHNSRWNLNPAAKMVSLFLSSYGQLD